jgi:putative ABC transport system permease protein
MLLGEQGLLTIAAIPLGFLIGYAICVLLTTAMQTELYRMPLIVKPATYAIAVLVVGLSSASTAALIYRQVGRFDLIEVLKARE